MAIGELADGLDIDLDAVPKKYEGLDGTELAISESQERMAVVVAPEDADAFIAAGPARRIWRPSVVAVVTETPRLVMRWKGKTHRGPVPGVPEHQRRGEARRRCACSRRPARQEASPATSRAASADMAADLNVCSQAGPRRAL